MKQRVKTMPEDRRERQWGSSEYIALVRRNTTVKSKEACGSSRLGVGRG